MEDLHIISWNVAGLRRTCDQLKRFGLADFFRRHAVDILCLQEVKLNSKTLASAGRQYEVEGFECFWCCNDGQGGQRQGLNGVCTYARRGRVQRADAAPLGEEELDAEGRCLLTDHGSFVIFNVYVPNSSGGARLPFKMRWLQALRQAMSRERSKGKSIILLGDLNMKHRCLDTYWSCLNVKVAELRPAAELQLEELLRRWPRVAEAMQKKTLKEMETRNTQNGQTFQKWAVWVTLDGTEVRLGPPMEREHAQFAFWVEGLAVEEDGQMVIGGGSYVLREPGELPLGELLEGMKKLTGLEISAKALEWLVQQGRASPQAVRSWFQAVLSDGMVDSFAEFHPKAQGRFTCWDQYRNKRHENEGSRIDYILVDEPFFRKHASPGAGLDESAQASLAAATYNGLAQPSPFNGGMPALEEDEYYAQFRADKEGPSTGIIYTPQQLSDHVAVSLWLRQVPMPEPAARCASTQRCQPHLSSKRITDFFGKKDMPPAKRPAVAVCID